MSRGRARARRPTRRRRPLSHAAPRKSPILHLTLRPGTDGALACAVMHVLFRDGHADRAYMARTPTTRRELEAHLRTRDAGVGGRHHRAAGRRDRATSPGSTARPKRAYIRVGYRLLAHAQRRGQLHAVTCLPTVTGAWPYEGGGALYNHGDLYHGIKTH